MIAMPILTLILSRYYMLRRGRELNKISLENVASKFMQEQLSYRCVDFWSAMRVWDNEPILNVYFDDVELKEQERQL